MNVQLINRDTVGELVLDGRLDSTNAQQFEVVALEVSKRFRDVILNLTDLEYTSSAGLRVILRLYAELAKKDGELMVKGVNSSIMEVFEMTGFASYLKFIRE